MNLNKLWEKYKSSQIEYDGFIFNSLGGLLNAFQSVFVLMVLSRVMPTLEEAGVFTFAYSVANLMLNIGKYGMRNYQVTDVKEKYAYSTYFKSRILTTAAMIVASVAYVVVRNGIEGYTFEKVWVIIFMCLFKAVDSLEDIYFGRYQQAGRLDIAGKCMTVHMLLVILSYVICLVAGMDLLASTIVTTVVSAVVTFALILPTRKIADPGWNKNKMLRPKERSWPLLLECTGLAIAAFVSFYQINCPKYAIDSLMTDVDQANFGFISMPVFFASLICQFLYLPMLTGLAAKFQMNDHKGLRKMILKVSVLIAGACIFIIIGAVIAGIPVLSILYATDLKPLTIEFYLLMVGSGFLAFAAFLGSVLTTIRKQHHMLIGYVVTAIPEFVAVNFFVERWGLKGASLVFTIAMLLLMLYMTIALVYEMARLKKTAGASDS
ncbi:MAG: hypothetical protein J6N47_01045 [Lachnospiraceae bacterium]|nr:hypothetical protein [Lachnospiraceae bacterium]